MEKLYKNSFDNSLNISDYSVLIAKEMGFSQKEIDKLYKARKSVDTALKELEELSGKQFNPKIVQKVSVALKDVRIDINISQRPKSMLEKKRFVYF